MDMEDALVLLHGLHLAQHLGCNRILVNSDSTFVGEAMHEEGNSPIPAVALLNKLKIYTRATILITKQQKVKENVLYEKIQKHVADNRHVEFNN
jgi:ribonuclease HI